MINKLKEIFSNKTRIQAAYRAVFETPEGEVVLAHLAKNCHLFDPVVVQGDPFMGHTRDGERRVVLSIMKMLRTDFTSLQKLAEDIEDV